MANVLDVTNVAGLTMSICKCGWDNPYTDAKGYVCKQCIIRANKWGDSEVLISSSPPIFSRPPKIGDRIKYRKYTGITGVTIIKEIRYNPFTIQLANGLFPHWPNSCMENPFDSKREPTRNYSAYTHEDGTEIATVASPKM